MRQFHLYLGADHAGFALKEKLKSALLKRGCTLIDLSPTFQVNDDYPLHAQRVAQAVAKNAKTRGVLICGSGIGVSIAANRNKGIRAFDAHDVKEVVLAREHNDANVIALSGWRMTEKQALALIEAFLQTPFSKAARHRRRVKQLHLI